MKVFAAAALLAISSLSMNLLSQPQLTPADAGRMSTTSGGACKQCRIVNLCTTPAAPDDCQKIGNNWFQITGTLATGMGCRDVADKQSGFTECTAGTKAVCHQVQACNANCVNCAGPKGTIDQVDTVCTTGGNICKKGD